jgi:hypothetical protein
MKDIHCDYCKGAIKITPDVVRTIHKFQDRYGSQDICIDCQRKFLAELNSEYSAIEQEKSDNRKKIVQQILNRMKKK